MKKPRPPPAFFRDLLSCKWFRGYSVPLAPAVIFLVATGIFFHTAAAKIIPFHPKPFAVCPFSPPPVFLQPEKRDNASDGLRQYTACRGVSTLDLRKNLFTGLVAHGRKPTTYLRLFLLALRENKWFLHEHNNSGNWTLTETLLTGVSGKGRYELWFGSRASLHLRRRGMRSWDMANLFVCYSATGPLILCCFLYVRRAQLRSEKRKFIYRRRNASCPHTQESFTSRKASIQSQLTRRIREILSKTFFLCPFTLLDVNEGFCRQFCLNFTVLRRRLSPRSFVYCSSSFHAATPGNSVDGQAFKSITPKFALCFPSSSRKQCFVHPRQQVSIVGKFLEYVSTRSAFLQSGTKQWAEGYQRQTHDEAACYNRDESQPVYSEIDEDDRCLPPGAAGGVCSERASTPAAARARLAASRPPPPNRTTDVSDSGSTGISEFDARRGTLKTECFCMTDVSSTAGTSFAGKEVTDGYSGTHEPASPFQNHILFDEKVYEKMNVLRQLIFTFESSGVSDISSSDIDTKYLPLLCEGDLLERTLQLARENYEKQVAMHVSGDPEQLADVFAAAAEWRQQQQRVIVAARTPREQQQPYYKTDADETASTYEAGAHSSSFGRRDIPAFSSSAESQQPTDDFLEAHAIAEREATVAASKETQAQEIQAIFRNGSESRGSESSKTGVTYADVSSSSSSKPNAGAAVAADLSKRHVHPGPQNPVQQLRQFEQIAAQLLLLANFYRKRLAKKKVERLLSVLLIGDPEQIDLAFFTMAQQQQLDAHLLNYVEELIREAHVKYTTYRGKEALSETTLKLLRRRIEAHLELEKHKRQDFVRILSLCFQSRTEKRRAILKATLYTLEDLQRFQEWLEEGIVYGEETGKLNKEQLEVMRALVKDCQKASPLENRFLDRWGEENFFQSDVNLQYSWDSILRGRADKPAA